MIKAICVDLDGVFFTSAGKKAFESRLSELSGDETKVKEVLYRSEPMRQLGLGNLSGQEFWTYLRSELNIDGDDETLAQMWVEGYVIDSQVQNFVQEMKSKGYKLCICSNNNKVRIEALRNKFPEFEDDFEVKIYSYEAQAFKPSKEIFEALISESGVSAVEIVYADDNADRLLGAQELGISTFVFHNFEQYLVELRNLGVEC